MLYFSCVEGISRFTPGIPITSGGPCEGRLLICLLRNRPDCAAVSQINVLIQRQKFIQRIRSNQLFPADAHYREAVPANQLAECVSSDPRVFRCFFDCQRQFCFRAITSFPNRCVMQLSF